VLGSAVGQAEPNGGEGKVVDETVGVGDNGDDLDIGNTAFVWTCRDIGPAGRVYGVPHRYFNIPIREVLDDT